MILSVGWFIPPHTNSFLIPRKDLFWLLKLLAMLLKFLLIWTGFSCVFEWNPLYVEGFMTPSVWEKNL